MRIYRAIPVFLALVFCFPSLGWATNYTDPPHQVNLYETVTDGHDYGTDAAFYVYAAPPIENQHVSSVYVALGTVYYMAESGWFANVSQSGKQPRFFAGWVTRGNYNEALLDYASAGNHKTQVSYSGGEWHWFTDTEKFHSPLDAFTHGYSIISSERKATGDDNRSHFWEIKAKRQSGAWHNWSSPNAWRDNDADYNAYMNGSVTDWFVRHI